MFARLSKTRQQSYARVKEEVTQLLAHRSENRQSKEAETAITYCEMCIGEYETWYKLNETNWTCWQRVTIIMTAFATLAGVITIPDSWIPMSPADLHALSWLRAVPAAFALIAASFLSSFTYREDAVRHEMTKHSLWNELAKYLAIAEPYHVNEATDTSEFVNTVCRLVDSELRNWRALVMTSKAPPTASGAAAESKE